MVLQYAAAAVGAGASIWGGLSARKAAKRTQKLQIEAAQHAAAANKSAWKKAEKANHKIADWLHRQKEVTKQTGSITRTNTASTASSFDSAAMLKAAEASGINPITFLRNGGMAAFIKTDSNSTDTETYNDLTTTRTGHNAAAAAELKRRTPFLQDALPISHVPGAGEAVAGGIQQFANSAGDILARQSAQDFAAAQASQHQAFQRELMMMSLSGAQQGGAIPGGRSFYTPGFSTAGPIVKRQTQGGLAGGSLPTAPEPGDRKNTNPYPAGSGAETHPRFVDAEQAESRYGDIAQEFFGLINLGADAWHNATNYLKSSPTAQYLKNIGSNLGLAVKYDPDKPAPPLTFSFRPKPKSGDKARM